MMTTKSEQNVAMLLNLLEGAIGFELRLVEGSVIRERDDVAATARSKRSEPSPEVRVEVLVQLLISTPEPAGSSIWALIFYYVNGRRVAPPGLSHMTLSFAKESSRWMPGDWEADEYEEWTEFDRLS
jgi:hypothetical protein